MVSPKTHGPKPYPDLGLHQETRPLEGIKVEVLQPQGPDPITQGSSEERRETPKLPGLPSCSQGKGHGRTR